MKFTIEVNMKSALMTKRYEHLLQRLLSQKSPLTFHQLVMLIPAIRFHKFNIESSSLDRSDSEENASSLLAVVNLKNVD